jgi:predicted 3-demethylubiquinone-9 3-methyltransferase (glyoxalase superfamily)
MTASVTPFLMFVGQAEAAATFYAATVPDSTILSLERWGEGEPGAKGSVKRARVRIGSLEVICFDSPAKHDFTFTPSISLFVECASEAEIDRLYAAFIDGGQALMPLGSYGFSKKFAWLNDRFGVSWQFNLA